MGMNLRYSPLEYDTVQERLEYDGSPMEPEKFILNGTITDISSSGSNWVVTPYACTVEKIYSVIDTAISSAGAAAISFEIGGTAVTGAGYNIALSSGAGTVDSSTPTALNTLAAGGALEMITNGGSTNASKAEMTIVCKRT